MIEVYKQKIRLVLIETYWNVKVNAYNLIWNEWFRINRNILECKGCLFIKHQDKARKY